MTSRQPFTQLTFRTSVAADISKWLTDQKLLKVGPPQVLACAAPVRAPTARQSAVEVPAAVQSSSTISSSSPSCLQVRHA